MRHARVFALTGLAFAAATVAAWANQAAEPAPAADTTVVAVPDNAPVETAPLDVDLSKTHWGDAEAGAAAAATCAACHGVDGKGNQDLGAPDLTDDYWLYGNSKEALRDAIVKGRHGVMPAHRELLGETRSRLVAAYVWSLSNKPTGATTGKQ